MQTAQPTCLLIADISGYTGYLAGVELDHANDILTDLLSVIVTSLRPNFKLSALEGDAAFMFAMSEELDGSMLLDTIERCYFGFRRRRRDIRQATSCECNACDRIPDLDLKFVAHHGPTLVQEVAGRRELLGMDAIIVHRLLKNGVVQHLGISAYALITQKCIDAAGLYPEELGMSPWTETFDDVGIVPSWALDLEGRWEEEDQRRRVRVREDESILAVQVKTEVPPQVAWDFITTPGQRMSWQPWVTEVDVQGTQGGRRGVGSSNHCMHGKDAVIEEILDWRPYDYVTDRTILETPAGPVKLLHTIEFEPTPKGTTIHFRFSPMSPNEDMDMIGVIGSAYGDALKSALPSLVDQLDAAFEERDPDQLDGLMGSPK